MNARDLVRAGIPEALAADPAAFRDDPELGEPARVIPPPEGPRFREREAPARWPRWGDDISHSATRGTGAKVADHDTRLAQPSTRSCRSGSATLRGSTRAPTRGAEYWAAMELMGGYAAANHAVIHRRVAGALGPRRSRAWRTAAATPRRCARRPTAPAA